MTRCEDIQVLLALRPEDRSVTEERRVSAHLAVCAECAAMAEAYAEQDRVIRSTPRVGLTSSQRDQLLSTVRREEGGQQKRTRSFAVVGATAAIAILLTVAVAFLAVGPQRVWADLQRLLGYVPGIGFVNLEETRVLTAPVAVTRDGVTLRVEQVVAEAEGTTVVISSDGLPSEDEVEDQSTGQRGAVMAGVELRLPDGTELASTRRAWSWGSARLQFPPLPEDVYRLTLALGRLPEVPAGAAPENWEVPLMLRPATGDLAGEVFPQAYVPSEASETHAGVTLRVVAAVHTPELTALRVQVAWSNPSWGSPGFDTQYWALRDDIGQAYRRISASAYGMEEVAVEEMPPPGYREALPLPASGVFTDEQTLTLAPLSPSARRLTLPIDEVRFDVPVQETFTLDLGDDPQAGDSWELDEQFSVAGFGVHVTGVRLEKEDPERTDLTHRLSFDVEAEAAGNPTLTGIMLEAPLGRRVERRSGSFQEGEPKPSVAGVALPDGPFTVTVGRAHVSVHGPWNLSWAVAGTADESAAVSPLTLRPEGVRQTQGDLTLGVDETTLTDRLTVVRLAADDLPPGAELRVPSGSEDAAPYLEDDRGRRYELEENVDWQPERETFATSPVSQTLTFQPLQPLARRVTLRVPQAELVLPEEAAFDVTVPPGVELEPRFEVTVEPAFVEPPRSRLPWQSSDLWPVDITLDAADYQIHLTQAHLERFSRTTQLALTSEPFQAGSGDYRLTELRLASATGPDGEDAQLASWFDMRAFFRDEHFAPERGHRAALTFRDLGTEPVPAGRYHVEINGF
ncbi:MAG: hypothetical protein ACOC7N_06215, partial [Chloroflexota bacterium]